jgi:translation initiation factor 1 (eIF-1/SUI1)
MNNTTDLNNSDFSDSDFDDSQQDNKSEMSDFDKNEMSDFDKNEIEAEQKFMINRSLSIKYIKNGKNARTYLSGIKSYITESDKLENFVKILKKKLGAGGLIDKEENVVSFTGDHTHVIYEYIIKNNICPKNEITH